MIKLVAMLPAVILGAGLRSRALITTGTVSMEEKTESSVCKFIISGLTLDLWEKMGSSKDAALSHWCRGVLFD